jgi:GNAT superfamily N-acetyltransferase
MIIRQGIEADLHKVSRLWREMAIEENPLYDPNSDEWRKNATNLMRNHKGYVVIVAELGNRIIGFVDYALEPISATNKLTAIGGSFYVQPEFRDGNTAKEIYEKAVEIGKSRDMKAIMLNCTESLKQYWINRGFSPYRVIMFREV